MLVLLTSLFGQLGSLISICRRVFCRCPKKMTREPLQFVINPSTNSSNVVHLPGKIRSQRPPGST